jgi:2,4-dienoyl-CoA reductase-like NADH-dependent reductase (Old Yellow Enzyme family)
LARDEVRGVVDMFVAAARRCDRAGFDGAELHGAHGYLLCQFLSPEINVRDDEYGGTPDNRARILLEIIDGVRASCRADFSLGVRLSPERFGLRLSEIRALAQKLMMQGWIDYLDLSLWDVFKEPEEAGFKGRPLLSWFTDPERGGVRLGAAGKLTTGAACTRALDAGLDFVVVGRSAILHHDFASRVCENPSFTPVPLPVAEAHLVAEGLGPAFVGYKKTWKGFVAEAA